MRAIGADALTASLKESADRCRDWIQECFNIKDDVTQRVAEQALLTFSECYLRIKEMPTIEPQRWIPVTEALPEDGVTVWVTIRGHDVIRCEDGETLEQAIARISKIRWVTQGYWSEEEQGWNDPSFGCPLMVQPVAWMPMEVPEPYKGGTR